MPFASKTCTSRPISRAPTATKESRGACLRQQRRLAE
jgi:hypothetical protein